MSAWTPEKTQKTRRMWADGISAGVIAEEIGMSRNSVIGKINRMQMRKRATVKGKALWSEHKIDPLPPVEDMKGRDSQVLKSPVWDAEQNQPLLSLLELTEMKCKFPIGDPLQPGFGFCGAETAIKIDNKGRVIGRHSWCQHHRMICTTTKEDINEQN